MSYGRQGVNMRDPTCGEAARYIARLVGWFTQGGATDECGTWHPSGHHHKWALLSVLNEVQHEHFGPDPDRRFGTSSFGNILLMLATGLDVELAVRGYT